MLIPIPSARFFFCESVRGRVGLGFCVHTAFSHTLSLAPHIPLTSFFLCLSLTVTWPKCFNGRRQARPQGRVFTGDTETRTVHDSCDFLSSFSGHIVVSSFVCALADLRFICVTAFMAQENNCQSSTHHGSGACVTESMSVLTDPATYGILNSTNCPRTAAVLGELAARW